MLNVIFKLNLNLNNSQLWCLIFFWHGFQISTRKSELWKCVVIVTMKKEEERSFKRMQFWYVQLNLDKHLL